MSLNHDITRDWSFVNSGGGGRGNKSEPTFDKEDHNKRRETILRITSVVNLRMSMKYQTLSSSPTKKFVRVLPILVQMNFLNYIS